MKKKQKSKRKQVKKNQYKEKPAQENEEFKDVFKINEALRTSDYKFLREMGRQKGFQSDAIRRRVWPFLLHCSDITVKKVVESSENIKHKDEEQVKLDVVRSFNSYPKHIPEEDKKLLEKQLNNVIVHVLRAYPSLHYYQGYHDICSVFILLFGEKYACKLMEPISLFYQRDAMFTTMEPVLRQLTILDTLIRLEDVELSDFLVESGVLPYYCISWVITWCSHDLDDLEKIARLFDLFICSNPLMPIYFASAVVLSQREKVLSLPCDISTIHTTLTKLPKDLNVNELCQKACALEERHPVYEIQCKSKVALDKESAINRFELDWKPIKSIEELNKSISNVVPILKLTEREPIALKEIDIPKELEEKPKSFLTKKDAALYTLVTLGAGVGLIAIAMSNSDLFREWLFTGV